jgi:hypothetical protein
MCWSCAAGVQLYQCCSFVSNPCLQEKLYKDYKQQKQQAAGTDAAAGGDEAGSQQQQQQQQAEVSPFGCISATMGWETFHMTHTNFLLQVLAAERIPLQAVLCVWVRR